MFLYIYPCFHRYGDRIPRSFLGKSFAIVWTLVGLVIMSFLLADITSALISYSLMKATNKNVYGAKVRQWFNKNLIFVKLSLSGQLALVTT